MLQVRRRLLMLGLGLGLAVPLAGRTAAPGVAPAAVGISLALPADAGAVIVRWSSTGGMQPTADADVLLIHANGDFSARAASGDSRRRTGRLDAQALHALLTWLIEPQGFVRLCGEAMLAEIQLISARGGRLFSVMDGGEVRFEINLPKVQHRVSFAALDAAFLRFPEVDGLRRLHAIKQRLLGLAETAR